MQLCVVCMEETLLHAHNTKGFKCIVNQSCEAKASLGLHPSSHSDARDERYEFRGSISPGLEIGT